jgi:hypothetical protein
MKLKTKFNVGDRIYCVSKNFRSPYTYICEAVIIGIRTRIHIVDFDFNTEQTTEYDVHMGDWQESIRDGIIFDECDCFKNLNDAIKYCKKIAKDYYRCIGRDYDPEETYSCY